MYATWNSYQSVMKRGAEKGVLKYDVVISGGLKTFSLMSSPWESKYPAAYHGMKRQNIQFTYYQQAVLDELDKLEV